MTGVSTAVPAKAPAGRITGFGGGGGGGFGPEALNPDKQQVTFFPWHGGVVHFTRVWHGLRSGHI
jgi:hypothetical protein